jgi:glycosyltransferase involved in cell wall biosynthesis
MKILIASELGGIDGGRETYLRALAPLLRGAGHELAFAFEHPAAAAAPSVAGTDPGPVWHWPAEFAAAAAWQPDLVFLHGLSDPDTEARAASRFPTVYLPHGYYGTCISGTKCHSRLGHAACRRVLGPGCLAAYLPFGCGGRNPLVAFRLYRTQRRRQANLPRYRAVVVTSRHMADEYLRHGVPAGRLHVLPLFAPGTAPDGAPPAPRPRSDRVLFVGRVIPLKGLHHLIAALPVAARALGRRLTLVVAGDGAGRAAAEAQARRDGQPAEFLGWVSAQQRNAEMRAADVLAVPSLWPEPFGLVGIEAGSVGLPAVGYATGGIPDWLTPGVSGESAAGARPDPQALAAALVRALADDDHRQRLRLGAWQMAQRFSPDAHCTRLVQILQEYAHASTPHVC